MTDEQPARDQPTGVAANESTVGDERMLAATGRHPSEWFTSMDAAGAMTWTHPQIVRWLAEEFAVEPWWCQAIAVRFE